MPPADLGRLRRAGCIQRRGAGSRDPPAAAISGGGSSRSRPRGAATP